MTLLLFPKADGSSTPSSWLQSGSITPQATTAVAHHPVVPVTDARQPSSRRVAPMCRYGAGVVRLCLHTQRPRPAPPPRRPPPPVGPRPPRPGLARGFRPVSAGPPCSLTGPWWALRDSNPELIALSRCLLIGARELGELLRQPPKSPSWRTLFTDRDGRDRDGIHEKEPLTRGEPVWQF